MMKEKDAQQLYRIIPCLQQDGPVLNIFLHGFFSLHKSDSYALRAQTIAQLDSLKNGSSWLVYWDSGNSKDVVNKASSNPIIHYGLASRSLPVAAGALSYAAYRYYRANENKANELGKTLWRAIAEKIVKEKRSFTQINLIGHSLGARIIVRSLMQGWIQEHYLPIHHVILLAGVVELKQDWQAIVDSLSGALFNVYSKHDMALVLRPGIGKLIGRHPIPLEHPKMVNHYTNLNHNDYWKYMDKILVNLEDQWLKRNASA